MTAEQKLAALDNAIRRATMGLTKFVLCPYCGVNLDFTPPSALEEHYHFPTCCPDFALGAIAILQRIEQQEMVDVANRIRDNALGGGVMN